LLYGRSAKTNEEEAPYMMNKHTTAYKSKLPYVTKWNVSLGQTVQNFGVVMDSNYFLIIILNLIIPCFW